MSVLIVGFPYIRKRYFETWKYVSEPDSLRFLLPHHWTAKKGKVVFTPPQDSRVVTTKTLFHDSHTPLIGGLLKGWMPAFPIHLWRMRKEIALVYATSEPILLSTLYFGVFTKLFGKKLVLFSWENIPYEKKFRGLSRLIHSLLLAINLWLADGLICGNPEGAEIHGKYTNIPIEVIPMNGVNSQEFMPSEKKSFRGEVWNERIVFTYIGAIGYRKGIHLAVRAFTDVVKNIPNAYLVIAGSGEYDEKLMKEISNSSYAERITRIPWLNDSGVKELLNASDVFLYPSISYRGWAEQFGYSMAEASLMELPVISTRSGSIAQAVRNEETGILVEPDNEEALIGAMTRLGTDSELRVRLGKEGRRYISARFSHKVVAREFFSFFKKILA